MLRVAEGRRFGVHFVGALANVGAAKDAKTFGVRCHHPIFDAVVHHFDEMSGAACPAMEIALLGRTAHLLAPRCAGDFADSRSQRFENWNDALYGIAWAADHPAVAALRTPYATASSHVHVMDLLLGELLGAANVVHIVRVAAIDQDVAWLQVRE